MTHAQLAILFAGLAIVCLSCSTLLQRRINRRSKRENWDAICQRWLREGKIVAYSIGPETVTIDFAPNYWHDE